MAPRPRARKSGDQLGAGSAAGPASGPVVARAGGEQRARVGVRAAPRARRRSAPSSITLPANSSVTRSQICATTPRSWVTNMHRGAVRRLHAAQISRRICFCTVTSSAVVGSSAMMSLRLERESGGDQHALAHAAGELVRIAAQHALGLADMHLVEQLRARACAPARASSAAHAAAGRRSAAPRCGGRD